MNLVQFLILVSILVPLVIILIFAWFNRKAISAFLFPDRWNSITMLELDNNVVNWIQRKNEDLSFEFNEGVYYMYFPDVEYEEKLVNGQKIRTPILKRNSAINREGRLGKFFYVEGNGNPLDYRQKEITGSAKITKHLQKVDISKLITTEESIMGKLFRDYGIFILLGLGIIFLVVIVQMGG